tara:strand:- start:1263 stop:1577 length:315 start_codon:yes stop_codon:yes gene_type:complete
MDSNMDLINDLFGDEINYDVNIENNKDKNYYIGQAEHIIKNIENPSNYFFFLKTILKNGNKLSIEQKKEIEKILDIKPTLVYKDKIVTKIVYKDKKPKIKVDDY